MKIFLNIQQQLNHWITDVARSLGLLEASFQPEVRVADPRFGDFQSNGVLAYAKRSGQNAREVANQLMDALKASEFARESGIEMGLAGPGFINFKLSPKFIAEWLKTFHMPVVIEMAAQDTYGLKGRKIIIDYSSPNTAKQMHVGHLRSMIIGEALQRLLRFCGADIVRDNHLGDWGTQFGILIMAIKRSKYDLDAIHGDVIDDLERLYKEGSAAFKENDEAKEEARRELVMLQNGDPQNMEIWRKITKVSYQLFDEIYKQMGVAFDQIQGESFYRDKVDRVYRELEETKIAGISEGALVVFHPEHPRFKEVPFIIRKADGASNYGSTDLATAIHHVEVANAQELVYVTDGRQRDHFEQLFLTVKKWFEAKGYHLPEMHHAWFGMVLGEDGKAIKTRSGDPIKLKDLLQEAKERAYAIVTQKNPTLSEEERKNIARVVGLGAVKYADLSQNRTSDYVFSWEKLLSFEGNTAPYLLYAVARIHSIFTKAGMKLEDVMALNEALDLETPEELALAKKIMHFGLAIDEAIKELKPHFICSYLYELSGAFSSFYNANRVIGEAVHVQNRRLSLCAQTLNVLELGLHLLGIETLRRM